MEKYEIDFINFLNGCGLFYIDCNSDIGIVSTFSNVRKLNFSGPQIREFARKYSSEILNVRNSRDDNGFKLKF